MNRYPRVGITVVMATLVVAAALAGGAGESARPNGSGGPLPMRYVVPGTAPAELDIAMAAVNEKLAADGVNIEVEVVYIGWDVWDQRTNLMLSTGEPFELFHVMENRVPSPTFAARGALTPLNDLIDEYAPELREMFTEDQWTAVTVDGEIYAIPAIWRQIVGVGGDSGRIYARKDVLDRYGLSVPANPTEIIETAEALQAAIEADTGETWYVWSHELHVAPVWLFRAMDTYPFFVQHSEEILLVRDDGTVEPYYRTTEFRQTATVYRDMYERGLIHPDILSLPREARPQTVNQQGRFLFGMGTSGYQDLPVVRLNVPEAELTDFYLRPEVPFYSNLSVLNSNAVPATTSDPATGLQFLNWLYGDRENHDLFVYGIAGRHYRPVESNRLETIRGQSDQPLYRHEEWQISWAPFNRYETTAVQEQLLLETVPLDPSRVQAGVVLGFNFDSEPVNTEYTNILAARQEFFYPIKWGVVEYEEFYEQLDQRMRAAGIDRVVDEYQRQLDAFRANR